MLQVQSNPANRVRLIPNFCTLPVALSLALAMELVALCFTLSASVRTGGFIQRLGLLSLYLQWIGLCSAASLCWWVHRPLKTQRSFPVSWIKLVCDIRC